MGVRRKAKDPLASSFSVLVDLWIKGQRQATSFRGWRQLARRGTQSLNPHHKADEPLGGVSIARVQRGESATARCASTETTPNGSPVPGLPHFYPCLNREWPDCPSLRASNESRFIWSISFIWLVELEIHPKELDRPERPANQTEQPVRVLRARRMIWPPPSVFRSSLSISSRGWPGRSSIARVQRGPSEAARCASTGDQQATLLSLPVVFCPSR